MMKQSLLSAATLNIIIVPQLKCWPSSHKRHRATIQLQDVYITLAAVISQHLYIDLF